MKLIKKFLTKSFLIFCVIGVFNTLIHLFFYNVLNIVIHPTLSNTFAFIAASVFSYFANSRFTYKEKPTSRTFYLSFITFAVKLGLSDGLEWLFRITLEELHLSQYNFLNPIMVTTILLPLQFLVFNKIFTNKLKLKYES